MKSLTNQPSKMPTRKLMATGIATFVVGGGLSVADMMFPGIAEFLPRDEWIAIGAGLLAGYMTRDRAT